MFTMSKANPVSALYSPLAAGMILCNSKASPLLQPVDQNDAVFHLKLEVICTAVTEPLLYSSRIVSQRLIHLGAL